MLDYYNNYTLLCKKYNLMSNRIDSYFDAHVNIITPKGSVSLSLLFKNRLIVGDILTINHLVNGAICYYKITCDFSDQGLIANKKRIINNLLDIGINLSQKTIVDKTYIHPVVNYSCVDFSVDVSILNESIKSNKDTGNIIDSLQLANIVRNKNRVGR